MDRLRPVHPQRRRDRPGRRRCRLAPRGPARPRRHPVAGGPGRRRPPRAHPGLAGRGCRRLAVLAVVVTLLAIGGYVLSFWGYRLTRHHAGTLHVSRGLLTTRATSIEERRLRGVEVGEPVPLRWAGGRRLSAITTGLRSRNDNGGGSAMLVPPAAAGRGARVVGQVLRDPSVTDRGAAPARCRRPAAAGWCAPPCRRSPCWSPPGCSGSSRTCPAGWCRVAAVPLLLAVPLGLDRYRGLGHTVSGDYLVTRSGSLSRRRDVVARDGVIGWNVRADASSSAGPAWSPCARPRRPGRRPTWSSTWTRRRRCGWCRRPRRACSSRSCADAALTRAQIQLGNHIRQLPLRVRDDLGGVDRPEEREQRPPRARGTRRPGRAPPAPPHAVARRRPDDQAEDVDDGQHDVRHEGHRVEGVDRAALVVEPRQVARREAGEDRAGAPVAAQRPHEEQDEHRDACAPHQIDGGADRGDRLGALLDVAAVLRPASGPRRRTTSAGPGSATTTGWSCTGGAR